MLVAACTNDKFSISDERCARIVRGNIQQKGNWDKRHEVALNRCENRFTPEEDRALHVRRNWKENLYYEVPPHDHEWLHIIPEFSRLDQAKHGNLGNERAEPLGVQPGQIRSTRIFRTLFFSPVDSAGSSVPEIRSRCSNGSI